MPNIKYSDMKAALKRVFGDKGLVNRFQAIKREAGTEAHTETLYAQGGRNNFRGRWNNPRGRGNFRGASNNFNRRGGVNSQGSSYKRQSGTYQPEKNGGCAC